MENFPQNSAEKKLPALDAEMDEKIAYFEVHPEDIRPEDLNNLHLWMPGSKFLDIMRPAFDKKRSEFYEDDKHSALWLNQTLREYAETVEKTVGEVGSSLVPVYLKLREKGYSHYDLVL